METPTARAPQHFLFVTSPLQGHINPARRLAACVAAANPAARVTFSTAVSAHRLMFPSLLSPGDEVLDAADGVLHAPYSDGHDDEAFRPGAHDARAYAARTRAVGAETLSALMDRLASPSRRGGGRPVTRVVYTLFVGWAAGVARARGVPAALFWIQPATAFAVYYHCFHGHGPALAAACAAANDGRGSHSSVVVRLPGLPPLGSGALPSIVSAASPEHFLHVAYCELRDLFSALDDEHGPKVVVNTFEALERDALLAVPPPLELVPVGPVVPYGTAPAPSPSGADDLVKPEYMEWLDAKAARSVVYVSFGTLVPASERQALELRRGMESTNRPYLWARKEGGGTDGDSGGGDERGMVVEWCDQPRVLAHPAVGCFVTHCGWNSALESVASGTPVVAVPQWTDQPTVAWLVAERAGAGVRAAVDGEGVVGRGELRRCVEAVMGDGVRAAEIQARAEWWREKASEAVAAGGTSERNL